MSRLGQLLLQANLVTENHLARALGVQHFAGGRLGTLLLERGAVAEDDLGRTLALQLHCEAVAWSVLGNVAPPVIACLPAKFAIRHSAVPFETGEGQLKVVLRDPGDLRILDELFFVTGRKIIAGVAPEVRVYHALEKYYGERRTPRYAILAEKLSRPAGRPPTRPVALPAPPDFYSPQVEGTSVPPTSQEIWSEAAEAELPVPAIIQSWKIPDAPPTPWSPPAEAEDAAPEVISWEEMSPPSLWIPEPLLAGAEPPFLAPADPGEPDETARETPEVPRPARPPESSPSPAGADQAPLPAAPALPPAVLSPRLPTGTALGARGTARSPEEFAGDREIAGKQTPLEPSRRRRSETAFDFGAVAAASGRDEIAAAVLALLATRFGRAALFVARPDRVCGLAASGQGMDVEKIRAVEVPWSEPSVFLNVRLSRGFYLGALPPLARHRAIAEAVGRWPEECLVQPVLMKEKPVAFLYTDFERDRGATPLDLAFLRELAQNMAAAFAGSIRSKKKDAI